MKKHVDGQIPNAQLREEREKRGWSRAYIAEHIGVADPKTIGRWERGSAFPSAYFLQKLCALFQMSAAELGLWQRNSQLSLMNSAHPSLAQHQHLLNPTPIRDLALPPALAEGLVGRAHLLYRLKQSLAGTGGATVALSGLPGVGKTALASALAQSSTLQQYFSDGVLWASLGPAADLAGELRRWGELLEIDASEVNCPKSVEEWTRAIHARIGTRKMLLIIDDAWTCQEALVFHIGGPNCAYIMTTRRPTVAFYFDCTETAVVDELNEQESLELLATFVPEIVAREPGAVHALARLAGGLPLALRAMGKYLQALDSLLDAGLLESTGQACYTLHQTIVDFVGFQVEQANERVLTASPVKPLRPLRAKNTQVYAPHRPYPREENVPARIHAAAEKVSFVTKASRARALAARNSWQE